MVNNTPTGTAFDAAADLAPVVDELPAPPEEYAPAAAPEPAPVELDAGYD